MNQLADAAAYNAPDRCCMCTRLVTALFCMKWRHAAILKAWCQIENQTLFVIVDAYLLEEQSCQISSRSDLKRRSLKIFEDDCPNKNNNIEQQQ